ncbi:MAG: hypothetical protein ACP5N1_00380 [Candidatus Woesearchaeota archaeon]
MNNKLITFFTKKKIFLAIALVFSVIIILSSFVNAYPTLPTEFYGSVKYYNANASSGTISVYAGNVSCGSFNIVNYGFYGVLSCIGIDTDNPSGPGGIDSQNITFRYNNNPTTTFGDTTFTSGAFKLVNITFPKVFCGDDFCDSLENCITCELDCNECNFSGNVSQNSTTNTTMNNTQNGSSGDSSGGSGNAGDTGGGSGENGNVAPAIEGESFCNELWFCFNWSDCFMLGVRNRTCIDQNNCGSYDEKPREVEECIYLGTCFDNIINCHNDDCEDGVDCGGPCDKECPLVEQPLSEIVVKLPKLEFPKSICEKHINIFDPALWVFLSIIMLSVLIRLGYAKYYVSGLNKNDKINPLTRAKNIRSMKRKNLLFILTLIFLTIVSLMYTYYFLLCPTDFFKYFWMLILALILIPLIIHAVMKKFEYSEFKHINKNKKLDDIHYQNLVKMIELENNILAEEENAIANKLYELSKKEEFKDLMETDKNLKDIYHTLVKLYTEYKDKKNPFNMEKNICEKIDALEFDVLFKSSVEKHSELKNIFERLKKLYVQYGEKQKMYDKLDEIEQSDSKK